MKKLFLWPPTWLRTALLFLIPFGLYFLLIWASPLAPIASVFAVYSHSLFLIIFGAYFLAFRLPGQVGFWAGLTLTLVICALTLLNRWSSGFSDNMLIGGLLPYKDAKNYYLGAQMLMDGLPISQISNQAAGRPLFPGFLAIFLTLTGSNLQWALALIFALAGSALYFSARKVFLQAGVWAGSLFATLLFFYLRPFIGYALSEAAGFLFGSLAFLVLWEAARRLNKTGLVLGLGILMLAVSIRTGAFFIFPALIVWAGWIFRGEKGFSWKVAGISALACLAAYLASNVLYPRLVVEPGGVTFGNFAYALYGQVHGGVGWHAAIEATGTREPGPILQEAFQFFLKHPLSFFLAVAKSYRDFFYSEIGIFELMFARQSALSNTLFQIGGLLLLAVGIGRAVRQRVDPLYSSLLAIFAGIILSVPFLPPIDGGIRFHASSILYVYALLALGLGRSPVEAVLPPAPEKRMPATALVLTFFTISVLVFPVVLQRASPPLVVTAPACGDGLEPFGGKVHAGSFIDLVPAGRCGLTPEVCLEAFLENGTEKTTDDFYQKLAAQAAATQDLTRVTLFTNRLDGLPYYLVGTPETLEIPAGTSLVVGCADRFKTKNQVLLIIPEK